MPDHPPLPRRTLLKAAGAALAGLGLPVGVRAAHARPTAGAARRPPVLTIAVDVEYEIRMRGPGDRRLLAPAVAAVGHVNSERFLNFKPGTVMFAGIRRETDTDGKVFESYRFLVHPGGWGMNGVVPRPSHDLNRLYHPGAVPSEFAMIARTDAFRVDGQGRRTHIGGRETDYAVSDYAMMQISVRDYCA